MCSSVAAIGRHEVQLDIAFLKELATNFHCAAMLALRADSIRGMVNRFRVSRTQSDPGAPSVRARGCPRVRQTLSRAVDEVSRDPNRSQGLAPRHALRPVGIAAIRKRFSCAAGNA